MTVAADTREPRLHAGASYPAVTRLDTLDLLRGLCALAVAVFHYHSWGGLPLPSEMEGFLALCGTYGVSIFFVLSGFSLAHAYRDKFDETLTATAVRRYVRRRIGRLGPLFALVLAASIAGRAMSGGQIPDILEIIANLILVFGFVDPTATPVVGGWSIGIEVVFYVLFPLMMVLRSNWAAIIAASAFMTLWVSLGVVGHATLAMGWSAYVTPANHVLFFAGGVYAALLTGHHGRRLSFAPVAVVALVLVAMIAISYGASELEVVTGFRRAALVPLAILLVLCLSRINMTRGRIVASALGGASYPLYLIHPLLFFLAAPLIKGAPAWTAILLAVAVSGAIIVDLAVDKPLQRRIKALGW